MRFIRKHSRKAGMPPGSLVSLGDESKSCETSIRLIEYSAMQWAEKENISLSDIIPCGESEEVSWIDLVGLQDSKLIGELGEVFGIHPLVLEDVLSIDQRPKLEEFDNHLYCVLRMLMPQPGGLLISEQVSIVCGKNFVITFQERPGDVFDCIRKRLRESKGRIRGMKSDYLAYALLDAVVDNYYLVLEGFSERLEKLDEHTVLSPGSEILRDIHQLKRELAYVRRAAWPLREMIGGLERHESSLIAKGTRIYLRDVYDHVVQIIDTVEVFREMAGGLMDLHLSMLGNRMNEVMKMLTLIATIFIPLTFIAGIYGMNFNPEASLWNMPELNWRYGYPGVWVIMLVMTVTMLFYFRRRKWL